MATPGVSAFSFLGQNRKRSSLPPRCISGPKVASTFIANAHTKRKFRLALHKSGVSFQEVRGLQLPPRRPHAFRWLQAHWPCSIPPGHPPVPLHAAARVSPSNANVAASLQGWRFPVAPHPLQKKALDIPLLTTPPLSLPSSQPSMKSFCKSKLCLIAVPLLASGVMMLGI